MISGHLACPVCSGGEAAVFLRRVFTIAFSQKDHDFSYAHCPACGLVFNATPPPEDEVQAYYESPLRWGHVHERPPADARAIWRSQLDFLLQGGSLSGKAVLEPGCGAGYFLDLVRNTQPDARVTGYELSRRALDEGRNLGLEMVDAKSVALAGLGRRFDIVVLRHILEHVTAPAALLDDCLSVLAPGGLVFTETPSLDLLDGRCQDFPIFEHVNYFDQSTMERLLRSRGLGVLAAELTLYPPRSEKPYRVLRVLAAKGNKDLLPAAVSPGHGPGGYLALAKRSDLLAEALERLEKVLLADGGHATYVFFAASNETLELLTRSNLTDRRRVAAILDNNPAKWGQRLAGVAVVSPSELGALAADRVVIGSSSFTDAIHQELLVMGVQPERVVRLFDREDQTY